MNTKSTFRIAPHRQAFDFEEHDACAIVASIKKDGEATHGNVNRIIQALSKMGHRCGEVNGEGDGCGVLTDIPRRLWAAALEEVGKPSWLAEDRRFFVAHLMIPNRFREDGGGVKQEILRLVNKFGADVLLERPGITRHYALGKLGRVQEPGFWQLAGLLGNCALEEVERKLFELSLAIERISDVHVASLSSSTVVYKVRGSVETLYHYYPELRSPDYTSAITLGHARYSTNTSTIFERAQPFSMLGHNGEINTIARMREEARKLSIQLAQDGSDSQDLNRLLAALIHQFGFSLLEAMEIVFPPILSEVDQLPRDRQLVYRYYRRSFGPFAQGPAAIVARNGDECVFSVDALGLRPLWFAETEKEFYFSSEKGVVHLDLLCNDPKPLSPGEKIALRLHRNQGVKVRDYAAVQKKMVKNARRRFGSLETFERVIRGPISIEGEQQKPNSAPPSGDAPGGDAATLQVEDDPGFHSSGAEDERGIRMAALGWSTEDRDWVLSLAEEGHEPIGSLGYDAPLAALSPERNNLADYCKESVAVVTNPAVDRERETEHFSTQCVIGHRPGLLQDAPGETTCLALDSPLLLERLPSWAGLSEGEIRQVAAETGSILLEDLVASFGSSRVARLTMATAPGERLQDALERIIADAMAAIRAGAIVILLDDGAAFTDGRGWIDPHLAVAALHRALLSGEEKGLRRKAGLILRSGSLRNLHDLILGLGLGADAVVPYLLLDVAMNTSENAAEDRKVVRLRNTVETLRSGLEKIASTMGIHELRGYGPLFASVGLGQPISELLGTKDYAGSMVGGLSWEDLESQIEERIAVVEKRAPARLSRHQHFDPKIWKVAGRVARGEVPQSTYEEKAASLAREMPIALRHVVDFRYPQRGPSDLSEDESNETVERTEAPGVNLEGIDLGLTGHDLPFVIASMSFGSTSEVAFRAYAEGAYRLNMIALTGEGGEIRDMLGKYPFNRGIQIASGRFGMDIDLINATNLIEIKVGQGAKPGEGGLLLGRKVSPKVAAARNSQPGIDLISPSNNHDIYSIEDLSQFIEELKTANPKARVAVKVPVVPGIGIITVGIAKAGADIIGISGFDGGTGAARKHSIKYVGLPVEIGVVEAHRALVVSGLREKVEIWCDGGLRSAADVVKMICLGANRIGFGTLAMITIGCTICRSCQDGICRVGISTHLENRAQAERAGVKRFEPRDFEQAVQGIVHMFEELGEGVREIVSRLGFDRAQDLVGRSDLLQQTSHFDRLDLGELLSPISIAGAAGESVSVPQSRQRALRRPRNHLTTVISNMVMEAAVVGEEEISFEDDKVTPVDRALGTHLAGALTRYSKRWMWAPGHHGVGGSQESWRPPLAGGNGNGNLVREANLRFYASSVPGNGLGAHNGAPVHITVEGGAQDGVAKGMSGGRVVILKGHNHDGVAVDGSVGKGLAYGATGGLVVVQGNADTRACIRLSGADVIIGGEIEWPLNDNLGYIGARANVKGFLCEYMTGGRVLVLGDPGPWICAGMTGGILYLRPQRRLYLDMRAIQRRIAKSSGVVLTKTDESDEANLRHLLGTYRDELLRAHQADEAEKILDLLDECPEGFAKVVPGPPTPGNGQRLG